MYQDEPSVSPNVEAAPAGGVRPDQAFSGEHLVAVYESRRDADAVAEALRSSGVDPAAVRIADPEDLSAALVSEMRQETGHAWGGASSLGLAAKEQTRGAATAAPVAAAIGAVVGLLAGLLPLGDMATVGRMGLGALIGALFGGVVGLVVGGGLGAAGPATPGAAQGVTLAVAATDERTRDALAAGHPQRVDLVAGGGDPIEPVETHREVDDESEPDVLRSRLTQPTGGDWSTVRPEQPRPEE